MLKSLKTGAAIVVCFSVLNVCSIAQAQTSQLDLDLETAEKIVAGCVSYAEENDLNVTVAIFNAGATLKAFSRMNGAHNASVEIAQWKGLAAASFNKVDTVTLSNWANRNPGLRFAPNYAALEGGLPILYGDDQEQIGGVGVSGATAAEDAACARAGLSFAGVEQ